MRLAHVRALAGRLAVSVTDYQQLLACADPAAGTRRWGPLTGITRDMEQAIVACLERGRSDREVATDLGISTARVTSIRRHLGRAALPPDERTARRFADLDRQIVADYRARVPYATILRRYDVARTTLYAILHRHNVPLRAPRVRGWKAVS